MALGGGLQVYYMQNNDGSVRLDEMKIMAEVAKFARERQQWCHHSTQIPQVALLLSTNEYRYNTRRLFPNYLLHEQGILGWLVIGSETSAQFAALTGVNLKGKETVIQPTGKGKIGFLPYPVGEEYEKRGNEALQKDVTAAVHALFPNPIVEISGSPQVDVSISQLNGKRMVHLVNTSGDHAQPFIKSIAPVDAFELSIRCEKKPSGITLQPAGKTCHFTYANGKATIQVDAVELYDILIIE